jgi:DNA-binding transcriptional MerR regulator
MIVPVTDLPVTNLPVTERSVTELSVTDLHVAERSVTERDGSDPPVTGSAVAMRVEELASVTSVAVDTVRFYQKLGLLPPPRRSGRVAHYDGSHVARLQRIRALAAAGFSLSQIKDTLESAGADPLLDHLVDRQVGATTLDQEELARRSGLDPSIVALAVDSGLLRPLPGLQMERFSEDVLPMLSAARQLLEAGLPLARLAAIAVGHAEHVEQTVDAAIDVFRDSLGGAAAPAAEDTAELVDRLVPAVTRLVADHFERTLVDRATAHLAGHGATSARPEPMREGPGAVHQ